MFEVSQISETITLYLSNTLKEKGYIAASPSTLNFLSTLECGVNYGAKIARSLGVSRQMAAKTVMQCRLFRADDGKTKRSWIRLLAPSLIHR